MRLFLKKKNEKTNCDLYKSLNYVYQILMIKPIKNKQKPLRPTNSFERKGNSRIIYN